MANSQPFIFEDYLATVNTLLASSPPGVASRAGGVGPQPSPYGEADVERAQTFLQQSRAYQTLLEEEWDQALDGYARNLLEIRLMGAAAADLAIAERLLRSEVGTRGETPLQRSATTGGDEDLIRQAITQPEVFLQPVPLPPRSRGVEDQVLLETTWRCLDAVRKGAASATRDSITNLLMMDLAVLKEASELLGADVQRFLNDIGTGTMKLAVDYLLSATGKIRTILGPEGEARIREAVYRFIDELQEDEIIAEALDRFLKTETIYEQGKEWIRSYAGDRAVLDVAAKDIAFLQGSFQGRIKITDTVIKGLAIVKLIPVLAVPPYGPLAIAAAYVIIVGYVMYSAHDHVDSDKYAFFDRVRGVRGTLVAALQVQPPPAEETS